MEHQAKQVEAAVKKGEGDILLCRLSWRLYLRLYKIRPIQKKNDLKCYIDFAHLRVV